MELTPDDLVGGFFCFFAWGLLEGELLLIELWLASFFPPTFLRDVDLEAGRGIETLLSEDGWIIVEKSLRGVGGWFKRRQGVEGTFPVEARLFWDWEGGGGSLPGGLAMLNNPIE